MVVIREPLNGLGKYLKDTVVSRSIGSGTHYSLTGLYTSFGKLAFDRLTLDDLRSCFAIADLLMDLCCRGQTSAGFCGCSSVTIVETSRRLLPCLFPTDDFRRGM
jgi:hypothetical protein